MTQPSKYVYVAVPCGKATHKEKVRVFEDRRAAEDWAKRRDDPGIDGWDSSGFEVQKAKVMR